MDTKAIALSSEQEQTLLSLKAHFPFRKISGALHPETGEFRTFASATMAGPNALARKGWTVFTVTR